MFEVMDRGGKIIYSETDRGRKEKIMLGHGKTTKNIKGFLGGRCVLPWASRSNCAMERKSRGQ